MKNEYLFWEVCPSCKKDVQCVLVSSQDDWAKGTRTFKFKCKNGHTFKKEYVTKRN